MSKLYRCPHCGEKGISYLSRIVSKLPHRTSDEVFGDYELRCSECGGICWTSDKHSAIGCFMRIAMVLCAVAAVVTVLFRPDKSGLILAFLGFMLLINLIYGIFNELCSPIFMKDEEGNFLSFVPNTKAEIGHSKYLKPYGIYRLKFEGKSNNHKFNERFKGGMVPAQIAPVKKQKGVYNLRIIDKRFVPDEVLFEGAEFLVEDIDGIFICKGKITKLDLEY